jgi:hypothetical protein
LTGGYGSGDDDERQVDAERGGVRACDGVGWRRVVGALRASSGRCGASSGRCGARRMAAGRRSAAALRPYGSGRAAARPDRMRRRGAFSVTKRIMMSMIAACGSAMARRIIVDLLDLLVMVIVGVDSVIAMRSFSVGRR